jgi:hypothetical protein
MGKNAMEIASPFQDHAPNEISNHRATTRIQQGDHGYRF